MLACKLHFSLPPSGLNDCTLNSPLLLQHMHLGLLTELRTFKLSALVGFCFCLSTHLRMTHSISCLHKCRSYVETEIPKSQGPGNFGDLGHPYFGGTIFPSSAFCDPQTFCVQYGVQLQLIVLGNKQPNSRDRFQEAWPASRGRLHLLWRVFMTYQCWDCFENSSLPLKTKVLFDGFG